MLDSVELRGETGIDACAAAGTGHVPLSSKAEPVRRGKRLAARAAAGPRSSSRLGGQATAPV